MNKRLDIAFIPKILFFWYITIFISTEILSFLNLINRPLIILINLIFLITNLFFFRQNITCLLRQLLTKKNFFFYIAAIILILTFIQGFFSAPNTTDAMVRRLPIVMYWVQEHTLYQDTIRNGHDFMGPFSEYILLHLYLIFNNDRILFLSQWTAFAGVIILSILISQKLGASSKIIGLIAIFVSTLPIVVLQATSVQTDMVTTILVLYSMYFALLFIDKPTFINCILLSCAVGLGILTKATYVLFIIISLGLVLFSLKKIIKKIFLFGILSLLIILVIQARFMEQNSRLYDGILGKGILQGKNGYTNELISPAVTFSNLLKNTIVQLPLPIGKQMIENFVINVHKKFGLRIDDPRTNFYDTRFDVKTVVIPQEDIVSNPIHLIIITLAGVLLLVSYKKVRHKDLAIAAYLLSITSFIIFSTILKWQPFHSRLLIPFFIIGSICSMIILFEIKKIRTYLNIMILSSTFLAILLISLNVSKPFISYNQFYPLIKDFALPLSSVPESVFTKDREKQLFNARYYWYKPYKEVMEVAKDRKLVGTVTFKLMDEFEYPMWYFLKKDKLTLRVLPYSEKKNDTVIISTSKTPFYLNGYSTECIKTEIEYGYVCISIP